MTSGQKFARQSEERNLPEISACNGVPNAYVLQTATGLDVYPLSTHAMHLDNSEFVERSINEILPGVSTGARLKA